MNADGPGWGHPHTHEFKPSAVIGEITVERCSCGQVRHVVEVAPERRP